MQKLLLFLVNLFISFEISAAPCESSRRGSRSDSMTGLLATGKKINESLRGKKIPECRLAPRKVKTGFICQTEAGFVFLRLQDGWLDLSPQGVIWKDPIGNGYNQAEAAQNCLNSPPQRLPTKEELTIAHDRGIRGVLQEMYQYFYWSADIVKSPQGDQVLGAYGYSSGAGTLAVVPVDVQIPYIVGRCVQDPP